jgi:hypothetical protein
MGDKINFVVGAAVFIAVFADAYAIAGASADDLCSKGQHRCGGAGDSGIDTICHWEYCPWYALFCQPWQVCESTPHFIDSGKATYSYSCQMADINGEMVWAWSDIDKTWCVNGCSPESGTCIQDVTEEQSCQSKCNPGEWKCTDDGNLYRMRCGDVSNTGCWDWNPFTLEVCLAGCVNGYCNGAQPVVEPGKSCFDTCEAGRFICAGTGSRYLLACADTEGDGCLDFAGIPSSPCTYGCKDGACLPKPETCVQGCTSGQKRCGGDGSYLVPCTEVSAGCWGWNSVNSQGAWLKCEHGCSQTDSNDAECAASGNSGIGITVVDNYTFAYYPMDNSSDSGYVYDESGKSRDMHTYPSYDSGGSYVGYAKFGEGSFSVTDTTRKFYNFTGGMNIGTLEYWVYLDTETNAVYRSLPQIVAMTADSSVSNNIIGGAIYLYKSGASAYKYNKIYLWAGIPGYSNVYSYEFADYRSLIGWHHIRQAWGDGSVQYYWDGAKVYDNTTLLPFSNASAKTAILIYDTPEAGTTYLIDELHVSTIKRVWDGICTSSCRETGRVCQGVTGAEYSVGCTDLHGFGCLSPNPGWSTYCPDGCDQATGQCASPFNMSYCDAYTYRCGGTNGNYEIPCGDYNADGYLEWSPQQTWTNCPAGCDSQTGRCFSVADKCVPGEARCSGSVIDGIGVSDGVIRCGTNNHGGYWDWDVNNITKCQWGCSEDTYPATGLHYAACNAVGGDLLAGQNAVAYVSSNFAVAFQGVVMNNLIALIVFMGFFAVGVFISKSPTFGFTIGFGAFLVPIIYGWVHPVIVVSLIALGGWLVFKGVGGMSHG